MSSDEPQRQPGDGQEEPAAGPDERTSRPGPSDSASGGEARTSGASGGSGGSSTSGGSGGSGGSGASGTSRGSGASGASDGPGKDSAAAPKDGPSTQQLRPIRPSGPAPRQNGASAQPNGPALGKGAPTPPPPAPQARTASAQGAPDPSTQQLRPVTAKTQGQGQQRQGWAPREPEQGPGASAASPDAAPGAPGGPAGPPGAVPGTKGKNGKKKRPKRKGWRRLFPTWRMVLAGFIFVVLLLVGGFTAGYLLIDIPPANAMATKQANVYLYADGTELARDSSKGANRENVPLSQVPKHVQHAVLAAEDRDFYGESAVDPKAMLRAAWNTVTGKGKQSGSTITQQYVKNYYLGQEQTVTRKVKEFFISIKLDREVSKDDILEGYLNTSYFGRNAYGVQAAAQAYYGKDIEKLSVAQGAYLATLVNSPNAYDVATHPENKANAQGRWNYVLNGMVKEGWLDSADRQKQKFPMPKQAKGAAGMSGQRGYVKDAVNDYLIANKIVDEKALNKGGYRITTTLQKPKQDAFVEAVDEQVMSKVDKKARKIDKNVRVGGASVDPKTGKVVAMYGGIDYTKQFVNNATRRDYQVGSTFKPFVFTSAVQNGSTTQSGQTITPNTVYDGNNRRPVQGWDGGQYAPANEDDGMYGDITVREATDKSVNSVYAQMAVDVGSDKVKDTAVALGVPEKTPDLTASPSIALGPSTASVLDMTEAYATLANHGQHGSYTMVEKITKGGEEVALPERGERTAVSREAADTTTSILRSVVDSGTGTAALAAGRPAAGKTGTAEEDKAAWFAGYTPDLATVVAIMGADPATAKQTPLYGALGEARINGGGYPARVWAQFTKDALEGKPAKEFDLELEAGADVPVQPDPSDGAEEPGTGDEDTGGATGGDEDTGGTADGGATDGGATPGQDQGGQTQGQDQGQTQGQNQGQNQGPTGGQDQGQTQGQTQGQNQGPTGGGADGGAADGGAADGGADQGGQQGALGGLTQGTTTGRGGGRNGD
ncbi:transglycosylase domain-containing protein [Streptomyces lasiicapitis]|uniref:transglycosylase domain-containing protein n=1 Tax=Streptomyces lasiicapitis TaxID=1923961 RepID=UPI003666A51E